MEAFTQKTWFVEGYHIRPFSKLVYVPQAHLLILCPFAKKLWNSCSTALTGERSTTIPSPLADFLYIFYWGSSSGGEANFMDSFNLGFLWRLAIEAMEELWLSLFTVFYSTPFLIDLD